MTSSNSPVTGMTGTMSDATDVTGATPAAGADRSTRRRARGRRLGGTLLTAGALAFGGVSMVPSGVAEAAGITGGRLQHVATTPEAPTTTTASSGIGSLDPNRRETLRVRIGADGDVRVL